MLMLLFFIIAFGSLEILKKYGLQIKMGEDIWGTLKDPKLLSFVALNTLDAVSSLEPDFKYMDFFDKIFDIVGCSILTLLVAAGVLWLVRWVYSIFNKPAENEDMETYTATVQTKAFWWYIALNVIMAMYLFSVGLYRF